MKTLIILTIMFGLWIFIYNTNDDVKIFLAKTGIAILGVALFFIYGMWELLVIGVMLTLMSKAGL